MEWTMSIKRCSKCKIQKDKLEFHRSMSSNDGLFSYCKDCNKIKAKKHRDSHKEHYRIKDFEKNLRVSFGITGEEYKKLLLEQDSKCKICKKPETTRNIKTNQPQRLAVDHDHITGKVRGLLCSKCNRGIGFFQEDPKLLQAAIYYISQ